MSLTPPPKGAMYLFDYLTPPLPPDSYSIRVATDVGFDGAGHPLGDERFFDVVGPRFSLAASEVAAVFPPRNGHGPFQDNLAQVAIKRRTLPWERPLDQGRPIAAPSDGQGLPADYPAPWMALLLFEEGEYTLLQNAPLENVVPADVFERLHRPANILCDAVEADRALLDAILPSKEELQLLAHLRWVNTDDRELSVEGSDGWFAIVMTNRLPSPGAKCRACLVSLEERSDLVRRDPPATFLPQQPAPATFQPRDIELALSNQFRLLETRSDQAVGTLVIPPVARPRVVLLYSWQFVCEGNGTFYDLMQGLDVGMIGKLAQPGHPDLTDTGHLRLTLDDRGGTEETVFYRGPLVPFELTRDPLGPYHSADQARRVTPETGVEDVSYAAAFEAGRLLAAADARLAQELMRWRRESYQQSARADVLTAVSGQVALELPATLAEQLHTPLAPVVATAVLGRIVQGAGPLGDPYQIGVASGALGMNPEALRVALDLPSVAEAEALLGADPGSLGATVAAPAATPRPDVTLDQVAADSASLARLQAKRGRILENTKLRLGGQ